MDVSLRNRLNKLWWYWLPLKANLFSQTLSASLADGIYLTAWSTISAFAPLLVFSVGFLIGWYHFGFAPGVTFTFSIPVMAFLLAIGSFGAGIGSWLWLGYALGDFWLYGHNTYQNWFDTLLRVQGALVLSYVLLAQLLILIPLATRTLRQRTLPRLKVGGKSLGLVVVQGEAALHGLIQGGLVYVWANAVPTLIRPVFTWQGGQPPAAAIQPLQSNALVLVVLAIVLGVIRVLLENWALNDISVMERAEHLQQSLASTDSFRWSLPIWITIQFRAAFLTFLLSGILTSWLDAILLWIALTILIFLREKLQARMSWWIRFVSYFPLVLRLVLAAVINYYLALEIIKARWNATNTFEPIIFSVAVGLIVFTLLMPDLGTQARNRQVTTPRRQS